MESHLLHAVSYLPVSCACLASQEFVRGLSMAELATEPNNISEVNRLKVFGVESLQVDLWGVLRGHGSSCGRVPGSGWVLAGCEAHELARGWCGLGCRAARGMMHTCVGSSGAHFERMQHARCAPGPSAWSGYARCKCLKPCKKISDARVRKSRTCVSLMLIQLNNP